MEAVAQALFVWSTGAAILGARAVIYGQLKVCFWQYNGWDKGILVSLSQTRTSPFTLE